MVYFAKKVYTLESSETEIFKYFFISEISKFFILILIWKKWYVLKKYLIYGNHARCITSPTVQCRTVIPYIPYYSNNHKIIKFNRENSQLFPKKRDFSRNISN